MTINSQKTALEERYELSLIEGEPSDESAYIEIAKTDDDVFLTLVGDEYFAKEARFKSWRAAHRAMLKAVEVEDYSCAIQDLKEARDFAEGQLEVFYSIYKEKILEGLKRG